MTKQLIRNSQSGKYLNWKNVMKNNKIQTQKKQKENIFTNLNFFLYLFHMLQEHKQKPIKKTITKKQHNLKKNPKP